MDQIDVFHPGEQAMQSRAGVRERMAAQGWQVIRDAMPAQHRAFFPLLPYLPVAVRDADGWPVGTMLTGDPGFVSSPDPRHLRVDALPDQTDPASTGFAAGAQAGILGIDLSTRRRNRVNGRIVARDPAGFTVAVAQSFGNCPQYIQRRAPLDSVRLQGEVQHLSAIDTVTQDLVRRSDTFFVASGAGEAGLDMSHRGGRAGFVLVSGDVLTVPDFPGNRYFNTLGNFQTDPRAGLLFVDFDSGDLLQLNGHVDVEWGGAPVEAFPGARGLWRVHVTRGWRIPNGVALRWSFRDAAPGLDRMGPWLAA